MKFRICILLLIFPVAGFAQVNHVNNKMCVPAAGSGNPVVIIDTFCASWHICIHDSVPIISATLIDDPNGDVYGRPPKVYKNVVFDSKNDPDGIGEIVSSTDTVICFDVIVSNPFDTAYAPIYIVNKNGFHLTPILELRYKPQTQISVMPADDTLSFPITKVGQRVCLTLMYSNIG